MGNPSTARSSSSERSTRDRCRGRAHVTVARPQGVSWPAWIEVRTPVLPHDFGGVLHSCSAEASPRLNNSRTAAARLGIRAWNRNSSIASTSSIGRMICRRSDRSRLARVPGRFPSIRPIGLAPNKALQDSSNICKSAAAFVSVRTGRATRSRAAPRVLCLRLCLPCFLGTGLFRRGQRHDGRTVENRTVGSKVGAVAWAIPALLGRIPVNDAPEMGADR